jgi:hypothetical protein
LEYLKALQVQVDLIRRWKVGEADGEAVQLSVGASQNDFDRPVPLIKRDLIGLFESAEPYYVSSEICNCLFSSLESVPNITLGEINPPSRVGLVYFATPLLLDPRLPGDGRNLRGFAWWWDGEIAHSSSGEHAPMAVFYRLADWGTSPVPYVASEVYWLYQ